MADNMSFLPEDYLQKRVARRTNVICISLFAVVMTTVVAAFLVTDRQRSEIKAQQAEVTKQYEEAAKRLDQLEQLQAKKEQMLRKAKVASVLVERAPRARLLAELINNMPVTLTLSEFDLKTETVREVRPRTAMEREKAKAKKTKLAEKNPEPVIEARHEITTVKMVGSAPTDVEIAQYIESLNSHPLFKEVNLQYTQATAVNDVEMRKFSVELKLNPNIDLNQIEPTKVAREDGLKMNPMGGSIQIDETGQLVTPEASVIPAGDAR